MPPFLVDLPMSVVVGSFSFALLTKTKFLNKTIVEILSVCIALIYFNQVQYIFKDGCRDACQRLREGWRLFLTYVFLAFYSLFTFFRGTVRAVTKLF
jgi:hypothetical protein